MLKTLELDWDEGNTEKCQKHGVSIAEIDAVMKNAPIVAPDLAHSSTERRYIAIGRTGEDRPIYIAFTFRRKLGRRLVRPVSARYMHDKEIKAYEKKAGQADTGSHLDNGRGS